ncbi:DUF3291 domain-containing protein [Pseudonocardia sp. EV170527-09]|nr:DUF3291 domain-containing protein [Pseudonocardia sp. EV170527-09]
MLGAPCGGHRPCVASSIPERCRARAEPDGCGSSGVAPWAVCSLASGFVSDWEIAQVNIALPVVPLSEPELGWFVEALAPVNAVVDSAPGFRWRMQTEDGDATAVRAFGDDRLIVNMSVWASVEALADFVYRDPAHVAVLRRKRESFVRLGEMHQALWWVPAGHRPSVDEAEERLAHLRAHGPTPRAFTFRVQFPVPGTETDSISGHEDWYCRA